MQCRRCKEDGIKIRMTFINHMGHHLWACDRCGLGTQGKLIDWLQQILWQHQHQPKS